MALSTRKKNIIIAEWKTGKYSNPTQLAKAHKIDPKTAKELVEGISQDNALVVEAIVEARSIENSLKNSLKNPVEKAVVEKIVQERLSDINLRAKIDDVTLDIISGLSKFVKDGKAQKVVTEGQGMGVSMGQVIEHDMQPEHYEKAMNAIHKAGITLGVVDTKPDVAIQNNNNQQTTIEIE